MYNPVYESEHSVIGTLCYEPRYMERIINKISEDDFGSPSCAEVFATAHEAYICGKTFDPIVAADALVRRSFMSKEDAHQFIKDCMNLSPSPTNAEYHAEIVHRDAGMRKLHSAVLESMDYDDPREAAVMLIDVCQSFLTGENPARLKTLQKALDEMYEDRTRIGLRIDTGFPKLDGILKGMWGGNFIIIGARPGVGKSALAMDIARTAAYGGNKVLFYSLEMLAAELAERVVARECSLTLDDLIDGDLDENNGWETLTETCGRISKLPIYINDDPSTTVNRMRAEARSIKGLKLIVVDFLTLMQSENRHDNRNLEIGAISRGLKNLAAELQIPVIALAQLNRGTNDTEVPTLRSLRDSGELEQNANKVILMWNIDKDFGEVGVSVAKNRRGKTGTVKMLFDGTHMRYTEMSDPYKPSKSKRKERCYESDNGND